MTIARLHKVTIYGPVDKKEKVLADLQDLGCLHLIPLKLIERPTGIGPSSDAREALKFLITCPQQRQQIVEPWAFNAEAVEHEVLYLKQHMEELQNERDLLRVRIRDIKPWGDFSFPEKGALHGLSLWFYAVPHNKMDVVEESDHVWQSVSRDARFAYIVIIARDEPQDMPVARVHTGGDSPAELVRRFNEDERRLDDLQDKRMALTRWCYLFTTNIYRLEDQAELAAASTQTHDDAPVFALQAWAPKKRMKELNAYAEKTVLAIEAEKPRRDEEPPTLLDNKRAAASGQDLVSFYSTPGYWLWDPSAIVFYAFAVFFAMIVSDAAYGAVLGIILGLLWRKMGKSAGGKRLRLLSTVLVLATIVYGIMVGSYFGVAPPPHSIFGRLKILSVDDYGTMMTISILIGVTHLVIANIGEMWCKRWSWVMISSLGWILIFAGGTILWQHFAGSLGTKSWESAGIGCGVAGLSLVVLFTKTRGPLWKRLLGGLQALTRLSGAFGDTLSYLRLFALGLASASLATTFNDLGAQVGAAVPGIGFLLSIIIILLGHGLNLTLAFASGVIHGLRLNFIEFFNWSMPDEGRPFKAFTKKEARVAPPA